MKFTCEKCGRAYMADEKVRGRAFKMKCRQCGHHIVVKPAALPTPPPGTIPAITPLPFFLDAPLDGDVEDVAVALPLEAEPLSPAPAERPAAAAVALPPPLPRTAAPGGPPVLSPAQPAEKPLAAQVPAIELEESRRTAEDPFATMAAELSAELANVPEAPPLAPPDPFLAPDGTPLSTPPSVPKLSESEEAFADLNRMMDGTSGSRPLLVTGDTVESRKVPKLPRAAPVVESVRPAPPPPAPSRRWAPFVGLGFGLGAVAVAGWLVASSGPVKKLAEAEKAPAKVEPAAAVVPPAPAPQPPAATPRAPEPEPAAARPAAAPQAARAPEPEIAVPAPPPPAARPQPPAPRPAPAATAERRAPRPTRESPPARSAEARQEPARPAPVPPPAVALAAPPAQRPVAAAAPAPAPEPEARPSSPAAVAAAPASSGGGDRPLDDKDIEATINRHAGQFETCVAQARKGEPQLLAEQRRVTVTMTVNPSGKALYPTLDDQELTSTALGACLKKEAGRMAFPAFSGEAVRVRVPLVLR